MSVVSAMAGQANPNAVMDRATDTLRGSGGAPQQMTTEQRTAEIASLLARRVARGGFVGDERARLDALVAAEAAVSEEAGRRVEAVEAEAQRSANEAARQACEAADATARAASIGAFGAFAALLLGAIAAVLGARRGTREWVATRLGASGDAGTCRAMSMARDRALRTHARSNSPNGNGTMAEDASDAALRYRRAARKYVVGFLALLLGFLLSAFWATRMGPPEPRGGVDWAAVAALVAAFGTLATGLAAVSNLILARRAERREPGEADLELRRSAHRAQELEAKKPEEGSGA